MRIDKYLWCTRYFKTRSLASSACKNNHIKIDNSPVKASKEVFGGETITIRKNQINYLIQVLGIPPNRVGAKIVDIYRKDITPKEEFSNQDALKFAKEHYRKKGTGRPTKKDRRDLEDYVRNSDD